MSKQENLEAQWDHVLNWLEQDLYKQGLEGIVLIPLSGYRKTANFLAEKTFQSANFWHRKIAASLTGYMQNEPEMLKSMLLLEVKRDSAFAPNDILRTECQSVVEDIVFSATRWCRTPGLRKNGLELLNDIIERSIRGEYWNTCSYAMVTIYRYTHNNVLLKRFSDFARTGKVSHPSNPSLRQEKTYALGLEENKASILNNIEEILDKKDNAVAQVTLSPNTQAVLKRLFEAAAKY